MIENASIYNPSLGDEDHLENQIVFHYGGTPVDTRLQQLGIAQGLSEFTNSFDGNPVQWIKSGDFIIVVLRLEEDEKDEKDWRKGFWLTCSIPNTEGNDPYGLVSYLRDGYRRYRLHNGPLRDTHENAELKGWWTALLTNYNGNYDLGALGAKPYLRLASGVLSPDVQLQIEKLRVEQSADEIMVARADDMAFLWAGKYLDQDIRLDIQNWLHECSMCSAEAFNEPSGYVFHLREGKKLWPTTSNESGDVRFSTPDPIRESSEEPESVPAGAERTHIGDVTQDEIALIGETGSQMRRESTATEEHAPPEDVGDVTVQEPQTLGSIFSDIGSYLPSTSSIHIGTSYMPSLPTSSNMRALSSMSSFKWSLPSMSSMPSMSSLFSSSSTESPKAPAPPVSKFHTKGKKIYLGSECGSVVVYQQNSLYFVLVFRDPDPTLSEDLGYVLQISAKDLLGMGFAQDPPIPFSYLALDSRHETVTSTLQMADELEPSLKSVHDLVSYMIRNMEGNEEKGRIMRTSSNWWIYWANCDPGLWIFFCRKWTPGDTSNVLGSLHKDTSEWIESFKRRRGL